jgi:cation:H+ antiporter
VREIEEARHAAPRKRVGYDLLLVIAGVVAMSSGATVLVEAVRRIASAEALQTELGLTVVGFATGFELVALAWSASRKGVSDAVVAGVAGSFAYNMTMSLGAAALARPLALQDTVLIHVRLLLMLATPALVILLAARTRMLGRAAGLLLLCAYPLFVLCVVLRKG